MGQQSPQECEHSWMQFPPDFCASAALFLEPLQARTARLREQPWEAHAFYEQQQEYIRRADPRYQAFAEWRPLLPAARTCPFTVTYKDTIDVAGFTTRLGNTNGYRQYPSRSACIAQLLDRPALLCTGKVASTECNIGVRLPATNPRFPHLIASGSSTGSAVAVAAGFCDLSVGTDTVGSARWPAGNCGITALRLSYRQAWSAGIFPTAPSMDSIGLLTRTVADLAYIWQEADLSASLLPSRTTATVQHKPLRFGWATNVAHSGSHPEILRTFEQLLAALVDQGIALQEIDLPWWHLREQAWMLVAREISDVHRAFQHHTPITYQAETARIVCQGQEIADQAYDMLKQDRKKATLLAEETLASGHVDIVLLPLDPQLPESIDVSLASSVPQTGKAREEDLGFTIVASFAGIPALTLPMGLSTSHAPIGVQLLARSGGEHDLLRAGLLLEQTIQRMQQSAGGQS